MRGSNALYLSILPQLRRMDGDEKRSVEGLWATTNPPISCTSILTLIITRSRHDPAADCHLAITVILVA